MEALFMSSDCKNESTRPLQLFTLNSNRALAQEIAYHIGISLGKTECATFSYGEMLIIIVHCVRCCDVYVIQSTSNSVTENLMELYILIDALNRSSAATINIVMPYYGYARHDRKARSREPITSKLVANLMETAGADRIITLDLHTPQIEGFFNVSIDHLQAVPILS